MRGAGSPETEGIAPAFSFKSAALHPLQFPGAIVDTVAEQGIPGALPNTFHMCFLSIIAWKPISIEWRSIIVTLHAWIGAVCFKKDTSRPERSSRTSRLGLLDERDRLFPWMTGYKRHNNRDKIELILIKWCLAELEWRRGHEEPDRHAATLNWRLHFKADLAENRPARCVAEHSLHG